MKSQQQGVPVKNNNNNQKVVSVGVSQKSEVTSEMNVMHDWDPSDWWFMHEYPPPPPPSVVKDEGGGGNRGKKPTTAYNKSHSRSTVVMPMEVKIIKMKPRRERKPRRGGVLIHSPNNNTEDEAPPFEQQQQPGFRKYGQNNRGGGGGWQHNSNNNANINQEKPRQNLHYEYQPVGLNKPDARTVAAAAATDGFGNAMGQRYKERSLGQSRQGDDGGNFYGRKIVVVIVEKRREEKSNTNGVVYAERYLQPLVDTPGDVFQLRKLLPTSLPYNINIHIMDFQPGKFLNVKEVHYNQHGLLLLEGQGIYCLGDSW
ncbi:unnamed protein product [Lactuca saligna]|uniref:Uncharacterized protein n=1 Tax=Lactuca saligna TaxID=75948 RepID=A0AA35Z1H3_LACSI|nr:unnamed protein product [Lactuca saligna]